MIKKILRGWEIECGGRERGERERVCAWEWEIVCVCVHVWIKLKILPIYEGSTLFKQTQEIRLVFFNPNTLLFPHFLSSIKKKVVSRLERFAPTVISRENMYPLVQPHPNDPWVLTQATYHSWHLCHPQHKIDASSLVYKFPFQLPNKIHLHWNVKRSNRFIANQWYMK